MKTNKLFYLLISFLLLSLISAMTIAYLVLKNHSELISYDGTVTNDGKINYCIDEFGTKAHDRFYVKGWAIVKGEIFKSNRTKVVLEDQSTSERFSIPTFTVSRPDVYEYINHDKQGRERFINAGFTAAIKNSRLKDNVNYKILVLFDNGQTSGLIDTQKIYKPEINK